MAAKKSKTSKKSSKAKAAKKKAAKKKTTPKKTIKKKTSKSSTTTASKKKVKKAAKKKTAANKKTTSVAEAVAKKTTAKTKSASPKKTTKAKKASRKTKSVTAASSSSSPEPSTPEVPKKVVLVQNVQPVPRKPRRQSALSLALAKAQQKKPVEIDITTPLPRTKLSKREVEKFKKMLLERRAQILGDVDNLTGEALGKTRSDATGDLSSMPIHMADIGSDNWEKEFTLDLLDHDRQILKEIDEALERIVDNTYGMCLATHKPIGKARLLAKPWAKYCIEYALEKEARDGKV